MFTNPDHITLAVVDAKAAIEFFALLGFTQSHVAVIDGGAAAVYMGMSDMHADHITLTLDECDPPFEIQLLHFDPPPGELDPSPTNEDDLALPTNLRRRGFNHLAFAVDDIEATTAHLEANGVRMLSDEMDYIGRKLRFFSGPEGITLEMVERGDRPGPDPGSR